MMLRRYHEREEPGTEEEPGTASTTEDAPQAEKPAGRSSRSKTSKSGG